MYVREVFYLAQDLKKILKGVLLSLVMSVILAAILAIIVFFADISDRTVSTVVMILSALSVFFGAVVLAKNIDSRGLLNGLILAALYFLVLMSISFLTGGVSFDSFAALRLISILAAGMLGGILGINSKKA